MSSQRFFERFVDYFSQPVAEKAAHTLANGAEIELRIVNSDHTPQEIFTFTRKDKKNVLLPIPAQEPQVVFILTPDAAEAILGDSTQDIGQIGVNILKLVFSTDANRRVGFQFKAGFLTLFSKGYLGILTTGGTAFSAALAEKGLSGLSAIKKVLQNIKNK